jgi:hypothetical protein
MEDERECARREIREHAGIEEPGDEEIDWWLAQPALWQQWDTDVQARALIAEHGRLAHHAIDGQLIGLRSLPDSVENRAEIERLRALKEQILDINRPWRKLFRRRRRR